jgi:hypothetical protein
MTAAISGVVSARGVWYSADWAIALGPTTSHLIEVGHAGRRSRQRPPAAPGQFHLRAPSAMQQLDARRRAKPADEFGQSAQGLDEAIVPDADVR